MSDQYVLLKKDTLGDKTWRKVFEGTSAECFARFHKICPFSYAHHRRYTYFWYRIVSLEGWTNDNH